MPYRLTHQSRMMIDLAYNLAFRHQQTTNHTKFRETENGGIRCTEAVSPRRTCDFEARNLSDEEVAKL
jgi:hypothetical protein